MRGAVRRCSGVAFVAWLLLVPFGSPADVKHPGQGANEQPFELTASDPLPGIELEKQEIFRPDHRATPGKR